MTMELVKWPSNEMVLTNGQAGGTRKAVAVWSKADLSTGTSEHSRLEADHWSTNTRNSAHHFAQIIGKKAQSCPDGSQLREQSTKQLEIFQARIPGGSVQVIRSRTSTSNFWRDSKMWRDDSIDRHSALNQTVDDDDNDEHKLPLFPPLYWSMDTGNEKTPIGRNTLAPRILLTNSPADRSTAICHRQTASKTSSTPTCIRYVPCENESPISTDEPPSTFDEYDQSSRKAETSTDRKPNANDPKHIEEKWTKVDVEKRNPKVYLSSSPDLELRSTLAIKKLIEFIRVSVADSTISNTSPSKGSTNAPGERHSTKMHPPRATFEDVEIEIPRNSSNARSSNSFKNASNDRHTTKTDPHRSPSEIPKNFPNAGSSNSSSNASSDQHSAQTDPHRSPSEDDEFESPKPGDGETVLRPPSTDQTETKKNKKVEFSKTEVHFVAAEPGRIKIVETNGKPPPVNLYRRRRRNGNSFRKVADGERLRWLGGQRETEKTKYNNVDDHYDGARRKGDEGDTNNLRETVEDEERLRKSVSAAAANAASPFSTIDEGLTVKISSTNGNGRDKATSWPATGSNKVTIKAGTAGGYITKINFHPQGITITDDVTTVVPKKRPPNLNATSDVPIATIYLDKYSPFPTTVMLKGERQGKQIDDEYVHESSSSGNEYLFSPLLPTRICQNKHDDDIRLEKWPSKTNHTGRRGNHGVIDQKNSSQFKSLIEQSNESSSSVPSPTTPNRPSPKRVTRVNITKDIDDRNEIHSEYVSAKSNDCKVLGDHEQNPISAQLDTSNGASNDCGKSLNEHLTRTAAKTTTSNSLSENDRSTFPQTYEPSSEQVTRSWRKNRYRKNAQHIDPKAETHFEKKTTPRGVDPQLTNRKPRSYQQSKSNRRSPAPTSKSRPKRLIRQKSATARINIFNIQEKPKRLDDGVAFGSTTSQTPAPLILNYQKNT